jgi:GNAT superfamily N-acetyltransferase
MTQSVEIRTVDHGDFDAWLPPWVGYQQFYKVKLQEAVTRETWARFLDPAEPMHAVIATVRGQALGFAHSIYHRSTWTTGDYCYLQDLFVETGARGFGIGRALIEHAYADARSRGSPRVYWSTHETNLSAMDLYNRVAERLGFVIYRKTLD